MGLAERLPRVKMLLEVATMFRRMGKRVLLGTLAWLGGLACGKAIWEQAAAEVEARNFADNCHRRRQVTHAYERQVARRIAGELHPWPSRGGVA